MRDELHVKDDTTTSARIPVYPPYNPLKLPIGVKRVNFDAPKPVYNKVGDSGFDLTAMETVVIEPGATAVIPVGLAFELPFGTEIQIRPRSGISSKTKLRVTLGTDDSNYRGELKVTVDNIAQNIWKFNKETGEVEISKTYTAVNLKNEVVNLNIPVAEGSIVIDKGDRIAQGVICCVIEGEFQEKDELSQTARGDKGFGSSGV